VAVCTAAILVAWTSPARALSLPATVLVSSGATGTGVLNTCAPSPATGSTFEGSLVRSAINALGTEVIFRSNVGGLVPGVPGGLDKIYARNLLTGATTLVSVASDGSLPDGPSEGVSVSWDGRFVAFSSCATNLVNPPNPTPGTYVRDLWTGTTTLVSVASDGTPANAGFAFGQPTSGETAISADGRYVAFVSLATNLAALPSGDTYPAGVQQVYIHDRLTGTTQLASRSDDGLPGNATSDRPALDANGGVVAYESLASNLVASDTNPGTDVFVRDLLAGHTSLADLDNNGVQASPGTTSNRPTISANGQYVAFRSDAQLSPLDLNSPATGPKIFDVYVRDRFNARTILASVDSNGQQAPTVAGLSFQGPNISASGFEVAFYTNGQLVPDDTNNQNNIYVHNWLTGTTVLADRTSSGAVPAAITGGRSVDPVMAADGLVVAYTTNFALTPDANPALQNTYITVLQP
jgi:Tol biopolymer transport system component